MTTDTTVTVANIGTVWEGDDYAEAREVASEYARQARSGGYRADFPVVIFDASGDILFEIPA